MLWVDTMGLGPKHLILVNSNTSACAFFHGPIVSLLLVYEAADQPSGVTCRESDVGGLIGGSERRGARVDVAFV